MFWVSDIGRLATEGEIRCAKFGSKSMIKINLIEYVNM